MSQAFGWCLLIFALFATGGSLSARADQPQPLPPANDRFSDWPVTWGREPIERRGDQRSQICLNGLWRFLPDGQKVPPESGWGTIGVPGSWMRPPAWRMEGAELFPGVGPVWKGLDLSRTNAAWYARPLTIPESWCGRAIVLDLTRVSTDARVFIDGQPAGEVCWPGGEVELTEHVGPGGEHELCILVLASNRQEVVESFMDADDIRIREANLRTRGLIGDVFLKSRPRGEHLRHVRITPSVRERRLDLELLLSSEFDGSAVIDLRVLRPDGAVAKVDQQTVTFDSGVGSLKSLWTDARYWEVGDPYLYTLELTVKSETPPTIHDSWRERFGFREFWIEGKDFVLNGTQLRLRPLQDLSGWPMNPDVIGKYIRDAMATGFNAMELWPIDVSSRGTPLPDVWWAEQADELGFLLIARLPDMKSHIRDKRGWNDAVNQQEYLAETRAVMEQMGNCPSVIAWVSTGNFFAHSHDQNPRILGRDQMAQYTPDILRERIHPGLAYFDLLRRLDPSRPVITHHGGSVGDVHTVNCYLNFIPLQEREEWLSDYMPHGDRPFLPVEFGAPLDCSWMRNRNGGGWGMYHGASSSEPLLTEYNAIYLGPAAYDMETAKYRQNIQSFHLGENRYRDWREGRLTHEPGAQAVLDLFITNTWRSWRTWGHSAGMIPWDNAAGWDLVTDTNARVPMPAFEPGRRGVYHRQMSARGLNRIDGQRFNRAGRALRANNSATLAWIAGRADADEPGGFVDKTHHCRAGDRLSKQIVVINDTRAVAPYKGKWSARFAGQTVGSGELIGELAPAEIKLIPISFDAPHTVSSTVGPEGAVVLNIEVAGEPHADELSFSVYDPAPPVEAEVAIIDPEGKTTRLLESLGIRAQPWHAESREKLLVIGREAWPYAEGRVGDLLRHIQVGGTLLIMAQQPDIWHTMGFRVARQQSRRAFPLSQPHPVTDGLDAEDLRDWAGSTTLLEPRPDYWSPDHPDTMTYELAPKGWPYAGWRWGNRHVVSSAMLEKPHRSGWRPILQGEFDLAYSPLMELDLAGGRIIVNTLDLEDQAAADPAADLLARRLMRCALESVPAAQRPVCLVALDEQDRGLVKLLGLDVAEVADLNDPDVIIVVGNGSRLDPKAIEAAASRGARVLVLPRRKAGELFGATFEAAEVFAGSTGVPDWHEARGLGISDLHTRTDHAAVLITSGVEIAGDGTLGRRPVGNGMILFVQADPDRFQLKERPYLRLTRWRQTRTIAQMLANLGASFVHDRMILDPSARPQPVAPIDLSGPWQVAVTRLTKAASSPGDPTPDPGLSSQALRMIEENRVPADTKTLVLPTTIEAFAARNDGEAVAIRDLIVPSEWAGHALELHLGRLDDYDHTFFNGVKVGQTDQAQSKPWDVTRVYTVPGHLVNAGTNRIAIRIWDRFGGGGFIGPKLEVSVVDDPEYPLPGLYHPDYVSRFEDGDDPYRYFRW